MNTIRKFSTPAGEATLVRFTNGNGATAELSSLGAGIISICVPDKNGKLVDVVLGYDNIADYAGDGPCCGKIPGRYANRIAKGRFSLGGKEYELPVNNGPNHLHGGPDGFQNKIWTVAEISDNSVLFTLVSPDGDSGYPGTVKVEARYTWTEDNCLELDMQAETDADTVINLTNHTYWNLGGHDSGTGLDHMLRLCASEYLPTDSTLVPEGVKVPVSGSPMDFTTEKAVGRDIRLPFPALVFGKGYDNCWAVDNYVPGKLQLVATLRHPHNGICLEVHSDQPGVQVYSGNWLKGSPKGKGGVEYNDYDAIAIECQDFPDAPNVEAFPSTTLLPGQRYHRRINFLLRHN